MTDILLAVEYAQREYAAPPGAYPFGRPDDRGPLPVGAVGFSSGGWFALKLAGMETTVGTRSRRLGLDFVAAICPVASPALRYAYFTTLKSDLQQAKGSHCDFDNVRTWLQGGSSVAGGPLIPTNSKNPDLDKDLADNVDQVIGQLKLELKKDVDDKQGKLERNVGDKLKWQEKFFGAAVVQQPNDVLNVTKSKNGYGEPPRQLLPPIFLVHNAQDVHVPLRVVAETMRAATTSVVVPRGRKEGEEQHHTRTLSQGICADGESAMAKFEQFLLAHGGLGSGSAAGFTDLERIVDFCVQDFQRKNPGFDLRGDVVSPDDRPGHEYAVTK